MSMAQATSKAAAAAAVPEPDTPLGLGQTKPLAGFGVKKVVPTAGGLDSTLILII